ncbi:EscU/YscU/HrcU family type III secretion system export apparatus switch protein, partial [Treponema pallidum]
MIEQEGTFPLPLFIIDLQWFAAEDEGRSEDPTETKLRKAREEGRVPKSQDLNGAFVMLFTSTSLFLLAPFILRECIGVLRFFFTRATTA